MTDRELMTQVLEALERAVSDDRAYIAECKDAISTLRARLEQPEQRPEPVAWALPIPAMAGGGHYLRSTPTEDRAGEWVPLYASPPPQEQEPEPVAFRYKFGLTDTLVKICGDMTHMLAQCTIDAIGGTAKYGEVTWLYASPPPRPELSGAIAAEREACAKLCESYAMPDSTSETAVLLAAAIRARSAGMTDIWSSHAQKLIAAEREACARLVQDMVDMRVPASEYPAAIRASSTTWTGCIPTAPTKKAR